ncbi:phosphatase PAP2 family protein [Clostridium sardiniense]|uniref:phosphatase PAP2 family protein n=1 Tax=Clostridium sardiniense TaxID=29369 RepID=UPI003D32EBEF
MKKEYKIGLSIIGVLLIIFAFTDLNISHAIYNPTSKFGLVFEAIGEFPAAVIATFCTVGLMLTRNKEKSAKYILGTIGYVVLLFFFSYMAATLPVKYFEGPEILIPILAIIYIGGSYAIAKKYSVSNKQELRNAAIVGVLTFVFVIIVFNSIKFAWGRERYRHMIATGTFDGFSMWLIPQGLASGNEFMSFPSGHSANAAIMVWITLIPTFVTSLKDKKNWFIGFTAIWTVLVPISRVIVGAHFASDVTMGVTITLVIFTLLKNKYVKDSNVKDLDAKNLDIKNLDAKNLEDENEKERMFT